MSRNVALRADDGKVAGAVDTWNSFITRTERGEPGQVRCPAGRSR